MAAASSYPEDQCHDAGQAGNVLSVQEEIFTRPGSDLLLPIRRHLTLNHPDTERCDGFTWYYEKPPRYLKRLAGHGNCDLSDLSYFPNMRISENGSLIISNVTLENDGTYFVIIYSVDIENSAGPRTQRDDYTVHVEGNVPGVWEEIFTRSGSDLLLPMRRHLTLNHTDTERCDRFSWYYWDPSVNLRVKIAEHRDCDLSEVRHFPNTRISENGSLIISNVTPENDGRYIVDIYNSAGELIQKDYYNFDVVVPLSDPVLDVRCLQNGSAEISCGVENGTDLFILLLVNTKLYLSSERTVRATVPPVSPPDSWDIECTASNHISERSTNQTPEACPVWVSDPVLDVRCLQNGSAEISCWVEKGTDLTIYLTVSGGLEVYDVTGSERRLYLAVPLVSPPDFWNIRCSAKNLISERSTNQIQNACSGEGRSGMWSDWGQYLFYGVAGVLCTALLIFIVHDLRKMKNEKNRRERSTRRRDQVEMEMEPTYYDDSY